MEAAKLLRYNACAQIAVSSVLGTLMLLPMQPWFPWKVSGKTMKELLATHLDWYMLGFMQISAASVIQHHLKVENDASNNMVNMIAKLLVFGGWMNPSAYIFRGLGVDAFVFSGTIKQKLAATLAGLSATSILLAWGGMVHLMWSQGYVISSAHRA
jgi:hypothetical protein